MKISQRARDEFAFYTSRPDVMIGFGGIQFLNVVPGDDSPLVAWYKADTLGHGRNGREPVRCNDIPALQHALDAKATFNLHIKLWAADLADDEFMVLRQDDLRQICREEGYPRWVGRAVCEQAAKISIEKRGWVPRWIRYVERNGVWITPEDEIEDEMRAHRDRLAEAMKTLSFSLGNAETVLKRFRELRERSA